MALQTSWISSTATIEGDHVTDCEVRIKAFDDATPYDIADFVCTRRTLTPDPTTVFNGAAVSERIVELIKAYLTVDQIAALEQSALEAYPNRASNRLVGMNMIFTPN